MTARLIHIMLCIFVVSAAELAFSAGDVEVIPPSGKALVIKDSAGANVRFQVNESGEIIVPSLPTSISGSHVCRDDSTGQLVGCSGGGGGSGFVIKAAGEILGTALGSNSFITSQGYYTFIDTANGDIGDDYLVYSSADCTGQPYARYADRGAGFVFEAGLSSYWSIPLNATLDNVTVIASGKPGNCFTEGPFTQDMIPVVPNDPSVTGVQNRGAYGGEEYPWPITIEPM